MSSVPRVLGLGDRLSGLSGHREFRSTARTALGELLPGHEVLWTDIDLRSGTAVAEGLRGREPTLSQRLGRYACDHPSVLSYLRRPTDLTPRRVSDVASDRVWLRSAAYREVFRPIGGLRQLSLVVRLVAPARGKGFVVLRDGRDFADEERDLAGRVLPTLTLLDRTYAGGSLPEPARDSSLDEAREWCGLTPREHDILGLLADGLTATAIGRAAGISPLTVRKHLEHVYDKLGTHDRLLAVERARAHGLLSR